MNSDDGQLAEIAKNQPAERDFLLPLGITEMGNIFGCKLGTGIGQKCFPVSLHCVNLIMAVPLILDQAAGTVSRQSPRGLAGVPS